MGYLRKRLREGSSYAGLASLIPAIGLVMANRHNAAAWGSLATAVIAILVPEKAAQ